ncbi:hypothetical protein BSKO_08495 [Bryopsis sp. KO-2023]|nr:hypothetical protein BSKO_08495 [Bryopsis sp. KO-2023]
MGGERPELTGPADLFYNEQEAHKYTHNSRITTVQTSLTERALELLMLPDDGVPKLLLDLGCGSGLSGEIITEAGHHWVGMDISPAMLSVAVDREVEGDLSLLDMGQGVPFRPGTVDGAISISAVQWLCNADTSSSNPRKRIKWFFQTLYDCLAKGARAVLQLYPQNVEQAEMLTTAALKVGFSGGLVVDFPNSTRAKKYFLVLMVGGGDIPHQDLALTGEPAEEVGVVGRQGGFKKRQRVDPDEGKGKGKGWVLRKKEQMRNKGYERIPMDTRFTGRKRRPKF